MKNIRTIVSELSAKDEKGLNKTFYRPNDKVARLFALLRAGKSDEEIKQELQVSDNAYTTLRSRLRTKVQNYLVSQADGPKADVLHKLLGIDDILFTQKPAIALTTLKKLEKELIRYDLANELTVVYKYMKKLHLNSPEYYHYSQLYNRHVAYSLALDKAEDILAKYFKVYGYYYVLGYRSKQIELTALFEEMMNVSALYHSHRMQVYLAAMQVMHQLYIDEAALDTYRLEPIEDIIDKAESTFKAYPKDSIYKHLQLLFGWLRFEYYIKYRIFSKARLLMNELRSKIPDLLLHYENYGFPAQLLQGMLILQQQHQTEFSDADLHRLFLDFRPQHLGIPARIVYYLFRALTCYHDQDYGAAGKWLFQLNNEVSFKEPTYLQLEVRCLMAYFKFLQGDYTLYRQNLLAAQRLWRLDTTAKRDYQADFIKLLSWLQRKRKATSLARLEDLTNRLQNHRTEAFAPLLMVRPQAEKLMKG